MKYTKQVEIYPAGKEGYIPPQITTYEIEALMQQLGPARAFESTRRIDPIEAELLGLEGW